MFIKASEGKTLVAGYSRVGEVVVPQEIVLVCMEYIHIIAPGFVIESNTERDIRYTIPQIRNKEDNHQLQVLLFWHKLMMRCGNIINLSNVAWRGLLRDRNGEKMDDTDILLNLLDQWKEKLPHSTEMICFCK